MDGTERGRPARLRPVPGTPLLRLEGTGGMSALLLADLHLGLGGDPRTGLGPPEASAPGMARSLLAAARRVRARRLVIVGDVKHPIVGVPAPLRPELFRFFSTLLAAGLSVEIVRGNHDVGIDRFLPREVVLHPATGIVLAGVGLFHGHGWPSPAVLRAKRLVVGHLHPGFRLAPSPSHPEGKVRCWVRATIPDRPPPSGRSRRPRPMAREIVVLPAFNPVAGSEALNRRRPRPSRTFLFARFLSNGTARAYLLDGTDLGPVPTGEAGPPPGSPRRARSGP